MNWSTLREKFKVTRRTILLSVDMSSPATEYPMTCSKIPEARNLSFISTCRVSETEWLPFFHWRYIILEKKYYVLNSTSAKAIALSYLVIVMIQQNIVYFAPKVSLGVSIYLKKNIEMDVR